MARRREHYLHGGVLGLSIIQVICGVIAIILQIVLILRSSYAFFIAQGIVGGVFFFIAGILGIVSSQKRTTCTITAFLVLAIIAAVAAIVPLVTSAIELSIYNDANPSEDIIIDTAAEDKSLFVICHAAMVTIAVLQAILAIVSSGLACHGLCCGDEDQHANHPQASRVQYIVGPHGQQQAAFINVNQVPGPQGENTFSYYDNKDET